MEWLYKKARIPLVFLFLLVVSATNLSAVELPASPSHYVVDLAKVIDAQVEGNLNGWLQELEQKTTAQMIVLTLPSLEGRDIREFALEVAHDRWKLGQAGKDNGLLVLVAVNDRKYTIEVGYGLEGVIPDSLAGEIGRQHFVPYFRKKDFSTGIYAGATALANLIARDADVTISGMPELKSSPSQAKKSSDPAGRIIAGLIFLVVLYLFIRNPRAFLLGLLLSSMGGGGRRDSWGGGGGGFGSFGGGGGGGFGGGGASGSW